MYSFKFSVCLCVLAEVYIYIFAFSFLSYGFSGIYCLISINNKIVLRHLFYKMWLVFLKFTLLPFGVGLADLTNISYDAVCLFSYKSQMKFKSGKNKKIGTRDAAGCVTGVRTTVFLQSVTLQTHPNIKYICFV